MTAPVRILLAEDNLVSQRVALLLLQRLGHDARAVASGTEALAALKRAYKTLYKSGLSLADAQTAIAGEAALHPELLPLAEFLASAGRGIVR